VIVSRMQTIWDEFEAYGYRRVGAEFRHQGIVVNHKKIRRLVREHDLQAKRGRRYVARPTAIMTVRSFPIALAT
jgi:putative transposase